MRVFTNRHYSILGNSQRKPILKQDRTFFGIRQRIIVREIPCQKSAPSPLRQLFHIHLPVLALQELRNTVQYFTKMNVTELKSSDKILVFRNTCIKDVSRGMQSIRNNPKFLFQWSKCVNGNNSSDWACGERFNANFSSNRPPLLGSGDYIYRDSQYAIGWLRRWRQ